MRARIRRFSSVELGHGQQPRKTERVEVSNRKSEEQGRAVGDSPRAVGTASGLSRQGSADVPLAQFYKPHRAALPLLPDHGSQSAPDPFLQPTQHRERLAEAEVTLPPSSVGGQFLRRLFQTDAPG